MYRAYIKIITILTVLLFITNINSAKVFASELDNNIEAEIMVPPDTVSADEKVIVPIEVEKVKYKEFIQQIDDNNVQTVYLNDKGTDSKVYFQDLNGIFYYTDNPSYELFRKDLFEKGLDIENSSKLETEQVRKNKESQSHATTIFVLLSAIAILAIIFAVKREDIVAKIEVGRLKSGKSKAVVNGKAVKEKDGEIVDSSIKKFDDVAGLKEVKADMAVLVDFVKNKDKYDKAGAKLPKGVILYGPPGTGKTLLAKAVAGEAGVPFYQMSGSDFIEMYVGVGAKRVRELFKKAKSSAPCIVFIDEIDTIGGKRKADDNGEDRKTINALLTEMDGFETKDNILVIGATNRLEDLDPALIRPGRFTNKYCVPLPSTPEERLEIINLYIKNKKIAEDFDLYQISKEMIGCSPAQIESIINESAIISVQNKKECIDKECFDKAMFKNLLNGHVKENQDSRDKEELKLVAWHEAGHALIGKLYGKDVTKVTILASTSGAGGVTITAPSKVGLFSSNELKQQVKQLYGGRCSEFLYYGNYDKITTGASNDIEKATEIIHQIVSYYGMNEKYGMLNLEKLSIDNKVLLEEEIKLAKDLEKETTKLLEEHIDELNAIALLLLEKETIYGEDLDKIIKEAV